MRNETINRFLVIAFRIAAVLLIMYVIGLLQDPYCR